MLELTGLMFLIPKALSFYQRLFRESFSLFSASFWNLTGLMPVKFLNLSVMARNHENFFERVFEKVSAWCLNLTGFIPESSRYGAALQRLFREGVLKCSPLGARN